METLAKFDFIPSSATNGNSVGHTHHKQNQNITVRPEPVEGFNQHFINKLIPAPNPFRYAL